MLAVGALGDPQSVSVQLVLKLGDSNWVEGVRASAERREIDPQMVCQFG
ncbi:Uncharacterised protein [Mycolicibacterium aichiense]|nr:Uncharacterised protein [Mycolicibacterium aichiense]